MTDEISKLWLILEKFTSIEWSPTGPKMHQSLWDFIPEGINSIIVLDIQY